MLTKLKLYGDLAEFVGHKEFDINANTVAKAVSFLINNFPKVEAYMNERHYAVLVNNIEIDETELHDLTGTQEIKFIPVISGAGSGFGKFLAGAFLIGASFLFPGAGMFGTVSASGKIAAGTTLGTTGLAAGSAIGTYIGTALSAVGAGLVLNGVSEMLFPLPDNDIEGDPRVSFSFTGLQNTSRAGTPVPICYGEIISGSVVISADITTDEVEV
tara:strand:- start:914 stop:1558 length:645 start_codon:yes stop_codon:yes gene_type:complete